MCFIVRPSKNQRKTMMSLHYHGFHNSLIMGLSEALTKFTKQTKQILGFSTIQIFFTRKKINFSKLLNLLGCLVLVAREVIRPP